MRFLKWISGLFSKPKVVLDYGFEDHRAPMNFDEDDSVCP